MHSIVNIAFTKFAEADYSGCLGSLEQLEILRPTDVKLAHNKIVAQCRAEGSPVQLSEVLHQMEGLAKTAGMLCIVGDKLNWDVVNCTFYKCGRMDVTHRLIFGVISVIPAAVSCNIRWKDVKDLLQV